MVIPRSYVDVPRGTTMLVLGDMIGVKGTIARVGSEPYYPFLEPVSSLDLRDLRAPLDAPPGRYTLELDGTWEQGTTPLYFGIAIH